MQPPTPTELRIGFVPGVTLRKWTRAWTEQFPDIPLEIVPLTQSEALAALADHSLDMAFLRLPLVEDVSELSRIRLYGEVATLIVPRDSPLADRESLEVAELASLEKVVDFPPRGDVKDAVALVAAGVGHLRLPHSLARLHARKDVAAIPIAGADETDIALVWPAESTTVVLDDFIGVVRGRTASSSRGRAPETLPEEPVRKKAPPRATGRTAPGRAAPKRRRRQGR